MKEKVIAYGGGEFFKNHLKFIKKRFDVIYICDSKTDSQGIKEIMGIPCISIDELERYRKYKVIITTVNPEFCEEIREELYKRHIEEINLFGNVKKDKSVILYGKLDECRSLDLILSYKGEVNVEAYCTHEYKQIGLDSVSQKEIISYVQAQDRVRATSSLYILACVDGYGFSRVSDLFDFDIRINGLYIFDNKDSDECGKHIRFTEYSRLGNVQFLISPSCNLNCKFCSHFSPLAKNEFYEFERFKDDLIRLKQLVEKIDHLDLWGGESLLCQDLYRYIYEARNVFPDSTINVGTNGLLLERIDKKLADAMRETGAVFCISLYPVIKNRFDSILSFLKKEKIRFFVDYDHLSPNPENQVFFRRYDLKGNNNEYDSWKICKSRKCHTIYNGKISGCYFPITARYFNEYFKNQYFETDKDCINIHQEISSSDLIAKLNSPMCSCRYCHLPQYEFWGIIGKKSEISDWVIT